MTNDKPIPAAAKVQPDSTTASATLPALPDRLSTDAKSKFYNRAVLERDIGIRFNGTERSNVEEYCVSEGWIHVPAAKAIDRKGNPMLIKLKGLVEPYFKA